MIGHELEERIAKAIRDECLNIFGSTWNYDVAHRLARAAIAAMQGEPLRCDRCGSSGDIIQLCAGCQSPLMGEAP